MSRALTAWSIALVLGCSAGEPQPRDTVVPSPMPQVAGPLPTTLAPVAVDVALIAEARPTVAVGDDLALTLRVRNDRGAPISVVRPVYGSWEHAREPDYRLEWTDEQGRGVLDPLGFAPGLDCGVLDEIRPEDRIHVPPGGEQRLGAAASARPQHLVLASARPGRYDLRVRYLGQSVPGATPLHLLSDPISVTITGGDLTQWDCRAQQVAAQSDHEYIDVSPARLLASEGGYLLIFSRYIHTVRAGAADPHGDIQIRRLGPDLAPLGDAALLHASADEVGWLSVTPVTGGALVVFTPGPVGGRSIKTLRVDTSTATPTASPPREIQAPPGNPYVVRVDRVGDRVAVLHHGPERAHEPLMLSILDADGALVGKPTRVAAMATDFALQSSGDGVIALWLQRGEFTGGVHQRFDRDGHTVGAPVRLPLDPAHSLAGVRHHPGGLDVAYADSGTRGDDTTDMMGLYVQSFDLVGAALGKPRPLTRESRTQTSFGAVTWLAGVPLRATLDGATLSLGRGPTDARTLASTAEERVQFEPLGDRLALLWEDTRDDRSPACRKLADCAPEVYGVLLAADGAPLAQPVRLTHGAAARPLLPSSHDWQRHCE